MSVFTDGKLGRIVRNPDGGPGPAGSVLTVDFEVNGQRFVALNGGPEFSFTEAVSFQVLCADQAEIDYYWAGPDRGRRRGPERLAQGPLRSVLAGRTDRAHGDGR
ncbi:MAG TPA: VOC family protein, partial [Pseudonocardia sp.]|nr:VOC family protein [Pseudonocardia sp.]